MFPAAFSVAYPFERQKASEKRKCEEDKTSERPMTETKELLKQEQVNNNNKNEVKEIIECI